MQARFKRLKVQPQAKLLNRVIRPALHMLCLLPFILLSYRATFNQLGPNAVETLTHETGEWALRLLLLSLAVTPLIKTTGNAWLVVFRRPIGLYAFFYALCHFLVYLIFDLSFSFAFLADDIIERPYITVGFIAFITLIPLALTSTKQARRKLKSHWNTLHRAVYVIAVLSIIHLIWLTKADYASATTYGVIFGLLMLVRLTPLSLLKPRQRRSNV